MVDDKQRTINEEFSLKHSSDNETKIQKILGELENAKITHTNYKRYSDMVENANTIIGAQMENLFSTFVQLKEDFNDMKDQEEIRTAYSNGIVPAEFYNLSFNIGKLQNDMLCWKIYQSELAMILAAKLVPALEEAKSLDIERDVLKGISEMENKRNELHKETINSMLRSFEQNMRMLITQTLFENKQVLNDTINVVRDQSKGYEELIKRLPLSEGVKVPEAPLKPNEAEMKRRFETLKAMEDEKKKEGFDIDNPPLPPAKKEKKSKAASPFEAPEEEMVDEERELPEDEE